MNKLKHTPGPWKACRDNEGWNGPYYESDKGDELRPFTSIECEDGVIFNAHDLCTIAEANARLIAAAPDMLAALIAASETLRQVCEGQHPDNVCCHDLRAVEAAIAKATASAS